MNLSHYSKTLLFESFFASFGTASWPTYLSMSCEAALKSSKKYFKKSTFFNSEIGS